MTRQGPAQLEVSTSLFSFFQIRVLLQFAALKPTVSGFSRETLAAAPAISMGKYG
jgi:hypothetical protein